MISQKQEITVTDEEDHVLYRAKSKPLSLVDKTKITDADGKVIARFERKKGIPFEEYKDERGADKTSRKQRCGDCYRKI